MTAAKEPRLALARQIAREAIVLLKNEDHTLPLAPGTTVALLGRGQLDTVIGGGGSGASHCDDPLQIAVELAKEGLVLEEGIAAFYEENRRAELEAAAAKGFGGGDFDLAGLVASGMIYELFGQYSAPTPEPIPGDELLAAAAEKTDTAILVVNRWSGGEECDRRVEDDYYLLPSEKNLAEKAAKYFGKVVVIFNVNGPVDAAWTESDPAYKAVLFMGTPGEQGAGALAEILTGKVSPSGSLPFTLARRYEDYPTAETFSWNKDDPDNIKTYATYGLSAEDNGSVGKDVSPVTYYREGIYVGYRYFDTFGVEPLYPFGYGLSYAKFSLTPGEVTKENGQLFLPVTVVNESPGFSGKETVQLYVSAPAGKLDKPAKELKAFGKTGLLAPGGEETIMLSFPVSDLASFDEEMKAYVIEEGIYVIAVGRSSADAEPVAAVRAAEDLVVREVTADIGISAANRGKVEFLTAEIDGDSPDFEGALLITAEDAARPVTPAKVYDFSVPAEKSTLADVREGRVSMEAFINQMSLEELAVLTCGYGPGLPFGGLGSAAPSTIQYEDGTDIARNSHPNAFPGYINPALDKYGIYSAYYKDGPASVGKTAWPTGMMVAATFNKALADAFGSACGAEAEELLVATWLAPGMNIARNPIGGRVFEYFSEDPYLCGVMGSCIAAGATRDNRVTVCPKHFAMNEQETYRRGKERKNIDAADSIVSARAAREIYLKPFEMVLANPAVTTLMSSFNKINGTFAAGNEALCTGILRGEWGYDGVVVTDWGDMDFVVDGADAVAAGNDVVMPGGPPVIAQVLKGYEEGRVSLDQIKTAVAHLMNFVMGSVDYSENR